MNYISLKSRDEQTILTKVNNKEFPNYNNDSRSLFDILGITPPPGWDSRDENGLMMGRYATKYEKIFPDSYPQRVNKVFWVGVKEGVRDNIPIRRHSTNCFVPKPVFMSDNQLIFDMTSPIYAQFPSNDLYEVPFNERWALQNA